MKPSTRFQVSGWGFLRALGFGTWNLEPGTWSPEPETNKEYEI